MGTASFAARSEVENIDEKFWQHRYRVQPGAEPHEIFNGTIDLLAKVCALKTNFNNLKSDIIINHLFLFRFNLNISCEIRNHIIHLQKIIYNQS